MKVGVVQSLLMSLALGSGLLMNMNARQTTSVNPASYSPSSYVEESNAVHDALTPRTVDQTVPPQVSDKSIQVDIQIEQRVTVENRHEESVIETTVTEPPASEPTEPVPPESPPPTETPPADESSETTAP